ncbi:MAG: cardiolipin synthase [Prevotellaceae bacterium]|jgi:cardiolipin synthase|nr:cardiolipin synthase [Prevotellaceae bacterium]
MFSWLVEHSAWWGGLYLLTVAVLVLAIVQQRGNPTKTLAWAVLVSVVPIVGMALYLVFGKNYRREKMLSRKEQSDQRQLTGIIEKLITTDDYHRWPADVSRSFTNFMGVARMLIKSGYTLPTRHNSLQQLKNGRKTYEALFAEIENAKQHIHLEYYIIEDDEVGNRLHHLLVKKARQGVEVRVIYDGFGSFGLSRKYIKTLRKAGVQVFPFFKIHTVLFKSKINYRNHRKIAVVDGLVGFVGGINIADHYLKGLPDIGIWRDTHLRLEGDAVRWLQAVFLLDWNFVSRQLMANTEAYFPPHSVTQTCVVQIAASGPDSDWASIMQTYFAAINHANHRLYIATPYFIPNEALLTALQAAALRGVDVRLLMSARSDSSITQWASMSYLSDILESGVKVFLYQKGFSHSKLLMADGEFCSVGTANMDVRSFEHNFEVNAIVYNAEFTQRLEKEFLRDIENSRRLSAEEWKARPKFEQLMENLSRLLAPLL